MRDQVLITDKEGKIQDLIPTSAAGEDIQVYPGLLCPGFVNAHCHLELSHLQGKIPENTGLVHFLIAVMQKRNTGSMDEIIKAAEAAEAAMIESGIIAVGDISNTTDSIPVKQKRRLFYHTFTEAIGFSDVHAAERMGQVIKTYQCFTEQGLSASITPHAPYSVSAGLFRRINEFSQDSVISIHNQECEAENNLYRDGKSSFESLYSVLHIDCHTFKPTGYSSLKSWLPYFSHQQPLILVHNTFTAEADIQAVVQSKHQAYWCLCPNANAYIEGCMPPVDLLVKHRAKIVLGTDSLASNHRLSVLEEIKTLQQHFPRLSLENLLSWAIYNGAQALGCDHRFGSFEKGKTPGIVCLHPLRQNRDHSLAVTTQTQAMRVK